MANRDGSYPSDVTDEEWAFCAPYLTLMREDAAQREHDLRTVFNALRWFVRAGCPWRMLPNELPHDIADAAGCVVLRGTLLSPSPESDLPLPASVFQARNGG